MTNHAQLSDDLASAEAPTGGMGVAPPSTAVAYSLLDHRTRAALRPAATAPPGRYLAVEHPDGPQLIPLTRPITHIGRGLVADVRLEDAQVSRRHAIVALRGEGARVLDDRSSHGTYVNGRRITVEHLSDGDILRVGHVVLRYVEVAAQHRRRPMRRFGVGRRTPWAQAPIVPKVGA